jgi:hypothetical protein
VLLLRCRYCCSDDQRTQTHGEGTRLERAQARLYQRNYRYRISQQHTSTTSEYRYVRAKELICDKLRLERSQCIKTAYIGVLFVADKQVLASTNQEVIAAYL